MIRKLFKRVGLLLGLVLLVPLVLALVGSLLLPRYQVKEQVAARLAAATGAQVVLGEPSLRLWPHLAVRLDGGQVSGTGADLARATGSPNRLRDFRLQLSRLDIQVGLRALLRQQIEVGRVTLVGPSLALAWDKGDLLAEGFALEISDLALPMAEVGEPMEALPEGLKFAFAGRVDRLTLQRAPYDAVVFRGDLDTGILTLESLTAGRSTGTISASGEIDFERNPWGELDFEAWAEAVPAGALLAPWAPDLAERLACDLDGEVSGTCSLKDPETVRSSLSLTGRLTGGEGVLAAADWLQDVAPYLGRRQDLKNIRFRGLEHVFRVDEGKYLLEDLTIDGHDTDWHGSGWVGLDGDLDALLQVKLPAGFTPELGQWSFLAETLRDQDGRVNLDLRLTGRTDQPKVNIDLSSLQGGADRSATDAVKKGLGGLLDKLKTR